MGRILLQIACFFGIWCHSVAAKDVTVFAAASLRGVLEEIAKEHPVPVRMSYGGSGTMARQVAARAPADVIVLASQIWMDWLIAQGVITQTDATVVATNALVVIGPPDAPPLALAADVPKRLGTGRLAMGQRDAVPAGVYARQWLQSAGIWPQLEGQLAETDNVRAALALVARRAAPMGVVYATDAQAENAVRVLYSIPPEAHDPITYSAAALTPAGAGFVARLAAPDAAADWRALGFEPATE